MTKTGISLGIDVATAHVRVVALDPGARTPLVGPFEAPLPAPQPGHNGAISQESRYADVAFDVIRQLVAELGTDRAGKISALCITATSGTLVPCDNQGVPLGDALMYNDQRGDSAVQELRAVHVPHRPSPSIGRLWWIAQHTQATQALSPADVILAALTGGSIVAADASHHLKSAIDPVALTWPEDLLDALHVPLTLVPELGPAGVVVGEVRSAVAHGLGLPPGVALVSGMTDGCTSQISTGGIAIGDTVGVLGTTLVIKATSSTAVTDTTRGVYSHVSPDGHFLPGGASNVGVGSLPAHLLSGNRAGLHEEIKKAGESGLSSTAHYPLPGTGERFPFHHPSAHALLGSTPTSLTDRVRSIMEGVGFVERLGLETLASFGAPSTRHFVSGGGSKSHSWNQLRATILGMPLLVPHHSDSAIGAALLAYATDNAMTVSEAAAAVLPQAATVEPVEADRPPLEDRYQEFLELLVDAGYLRPESA